ncbi:hypothetical protein CCMA1212_001221 [Trichoderma ghanense]|uniref:Uncharacterized protein n=1 Tax=Trichoderma ghanense TaxID=65468 RepID=A0ABY2HGP6_9HYPO
MGRPLFVAPVETDLPHKEATKRDVLSPGRSAIRRSAQAGFRDRRNAIRRAAVRIVDIPPPSDPQPSQRRVGSTSWETELGLADEPEPSSGHAREALRDVTTRSERRRDRYLEHQISSIFGGTWHSFSPPSPQRDDEARAERDFWWNAEPRPRRARVVAPDELRRNRNPHEHRSHQSGTPPLRPTRDGLERSRTESPSNDDVSQPNAFQVYRRWRRNQAQAREFRALMRHSYANTRPDSNSYDGLGDRDRSLSPEGWDTLLSTLTPDPQPPSATSSFASAAASQNPGPSNAPPAAPGVPDEAADGACESGHEMSDDDDDNNNNNYANWESRAASLTRDVGVVRLYSLNGVPAPGVPLPRPESLRRVRSLAPRDHPLSLARGRTSGSGSEDESRPGRLQPNREGSAGSGRGAHMGDEEWSGMQRIVRSLAAREDIPDEWWAEAGLNRTLPQDGSQW